MSDQIASVASGNIQSYEVLVETQLTDALWGVTVNAVVSVTKLTNFVQARGVEVEIQGGLFAANIRQQVLNEEAEIEAVRNMVGVLHELFQTAFDYEIEVGNPTATDASSANWSIPLTITAKPNKNMTQAGIYFYRTMQAISLTNLEVAEYEELNKDVYSIKLDNETFFKLRRENSFMLIEALFHNLQENYYSRIFTVDSGLDIKKGTNLLRDLALKQEHRFFIAGGLNRRIDHHQIFFPRLVQLVIFNYNDQRTLSEIDAMTGYTVQPSGVISRVMGGDVYNPVTGRTWMDRNIGALWPAIGLTDRGGFGEYYTIDEAQKVCPTGYRLPTEDELEAERKSWSSNHAIGAFNSPLKLPMPGFRNLTHNTMNYVGRDGRYLFDSSEKYLYFNDYRSSMTYDHREMRAYSLRCIKE